MRMEHRNIFSSQLVLRLLCVFCVYLYVCTYLSISLSALTYHMLNKYFMYMAAMRPYLNRLRQFRQQLQWVVQHSYNFEMDTEKQRKRRYDARLAESGNTRSEQLLMVPTELLTNREWLPGELLSGSERWRPAWFLDILFSLNLELWNQHTHVQLINYQGCCSPIYGCQKGLGPKLQAQRMLPKNCIVPWII